MKNVISSFAVFFKYIVKDKVNVILTLLPLILGILLYYYFGMKLYDFGMNEGRALIENYIQNSTAGSIISFSVKIILYVVLFFLVNWTFVVVMSIIASPFNDMMSTRIEKKINGEPLPTLGKTFKSAFGSVFFVLFNESKKMSLIIFLTLLSLVLNLFPILAPLSLILTILLVAATYVDYSWSRHNFTFSSCVKDSTKNVISYFVGGAFFFFLISIPVANLLVPSLATSFFTTLWVKNNGHRHKAS